MQKNVRINETQLLYLANKARLNKNNSLKGYLLKKSLDTGKWQLRYFVLYQNFLFYYENERCIKPSGVALLEGCYCEKIVTVKSSRDEKACSNVQQGVHHSFSIYYKKEGQRQYDIRCETEAECNAWVEAIKTASFSKVLEAKEELEQKHLHLLQILDSERQAKWHYVQQTEELAAEVKKLKNEVKELKESRIEHHRNVEEPSDDKSDDLAKIKKISQVQSFFRGWLCRRRWKQIVEEYIRSEHADSMRKRNAIVFGLVECEEEYVQQLSTLVSCFLRPFKMAASSKKPTIAHEDVNSIFLNAETVLFLHQIFLQGLNSKMDNWPTLQLGDLFDLLLPMLGIYQEYVRNHHFSLQVLAEYKTKPEFTALLVRYEEKSVCEGRSIESFLTYPMHQIPRYIITLHELLAHTPHDHVDREKLEFAKGKLEELSHIMHDEVSETENIRKNLAIERMIVEGCDILLDVNQVFVRQGSLIQVIHEKRSQRPRLGSFSSSFKETKKETVRQVFLFTNHLLITTRVSNGRLHLAKNFGKIPLAECSLVEDTSSDFFPFEEETINVETNQGANHNLVSFLTVEVPRPERTDYNGLDFRIILDTKSGTQISVTLVAATIQEKAAWCSDISQCIEQLHYSDLLNSSLAETSSVSMPHHIRSDSKLFRDDFDIKFSRTLNSCKVPQIRHASVERLLNRLTDLRFLSIDFLNTFLLTYRCFTNAMNVINSLKRVLQNPEYGNLDPRPSFSYQEESEEYPIQAGNMSAIQCHNNSNNSHLLHLNSQTDKSRRISTGMMRMEMTEGKSLSTYRTGSLDAAACSRLSPHNAARVAETGISTLVSQSAASAPITTQSTITPDSVFYTPVRRRLQPRGPFTDERPICDSGMDRCELRSKLHVSNMEPPPCPPSSATTLTPTEVVDLKDSIYNKDDICLATMADVNIEFKTSNRGLAPIAACEISSENVSDSQPSEKEITDDGNCADRLDTLNNDAADQNEEKDLNVQQTNVVPVVSLKGAVETESSTDASSNNSSLKQLHSIVLARSRGSVSRCSMTTTKSSSPFDSVSTTMRSSQRTSDMSSHLYEFCPTDNLLALSVNTHTLFNNSIPFMPPKSVAVAAANAAAQLGTQKSPVRMTRYEVQPIRIPESNILDHNSLSPCGLSQVKRSVSPICVVNPLPNSTKNTVSNSGGGLSSQTAAPSSYIENYGISFNSVQSTSILAPQTAPVVVTTGGNSGQIGPLNWPKNAASSAFSKRPSSTSWTDSDISTDITPRSSIVDGSPPCRPKLGAVVTSSRASKRRSSNTAAAQAFAVATAGSANPPGPTSSCDQSGDSQVPSNIAAKRMSVISTAATMRVLNVVRHWVSKFADDIEDDPQLFKEVENLLEDLVCNQNLIPSDHKAVLQILRQFKTNTLTEPKLDLFVLLKPQQVPSQEEFDTLSALDLAEQLTYLDHHIFRGIRSKELLEQAWMKDDKEKKAIHVLYVSTQFNHISRLVVSEIVRRSDIVDRVVTIEKWVAIADICRCMHNYNGVLQICAALVNSSVYRLKRTWEKLPKQTRQMIDKLQTLVSSDGRFKNMREALHRCDPPCIPYLGMYLTDLSFIEEGTINVTDQGLINFCKMRMVAHVIREIQHYQQTAYRIKHQSKVADYLLDPTRLLDDECTYQASLRIEPRQSIAQRGTLHGTS